MSSELGRTRQFFRSLYTAVQPRRHAGKSHENHTINAAPESTLTQPAFTYDTLDSVAGEIRLLEVLPTFKAWRGHLRCVLKRVSLDDDTLDCEAISYVWGSDPTRSRIEVNDKILEIPANADTALRRFALPDRPRTLWIDSVCINQLNLREREDQVCLMGKIYSNAKATLVYAGDENEFTARAFTNLLQLSDGIDEDLGTGFFADETLTKSTTPNPIRGTIDREALVGLCSRPWFTYVLPCTEIKFISVNASIAYQLIRRLWVVQEVLLSNCSTLYCGTHAIDMLKVLRVSAWLKKHHFLQTRNSYDLFEALYHPTRLWQLCYGLKYKGGVLYRDILISGRRLECLDPRDKVLGMLGLLHTSLVPITPDYKKPSWQIIRDAVWLSFSEGTDDPSLWVLSFVHHQEEIELSDGSFPCWVPSVNGPDDDDPNRINPHARTCRGDRAGCLDLIRPRADPNVLSLQGFRISEIKTLSPLLHERYGASGNYIPNQQSLLYRWVEEVRQMLTDEAHTFQSENDYNLARTLIADYTWDMGQSSDEENILGLRKFISLHLAGVMLVCEEEVAQWHGRDEERALLYLRSLGRFCCFRKFAILENGAMALVPKLSRPSDSIAVVHGVRNSYVLRPDGEYYRFLGECYVDGYMEKQPLYDESERRLNEEDGELFNVR